MLKGKIFITGGAGTLGKAIIERIKKEGWKAAVTVYSRDPMKHHLLKKEYPHVTTVVGDIGDLLNLETAMAGHDIVIHAAAMKHIPEGERFPLNAYEVNVNGSLNVLGASIRTPSVKRVIGISTDKVCHPINAYGCTKMMMERLFQEFASIYSEPVFSLVRYGNVLGSTGSVLNVWADMLENNGKIYATSPDMTRFWITVDDAVDYILGTEYMPSGYVYIPKMKALSMKDMKHYVFRDAPVEYRGLRPGEKMHESLLTEEESVFASPANKVFWLAPTTTTPLDIEPYSYSSEKPDAWISKEELLGMIA